MSDHDCPLWPEVSQLRRDAVVLDARVRALELHERQEPAIARLGAWLRWVLAGKPPRQMQP